MFKKLAVAAICFSCLNVAADQCPFGICIGECNVKDIPQGIITKQAITSAANIAGYKEINLNPANFAINGDYPTQAKLYINAAGTIEAIVLDYDANNVKILASDLDKKYPKIYEKKTFYGSYDIEYRNDGCLIRITKSFGRGTQLIYGTINWFEKYDTYYNQLDEVREKRRGYAAANEPAQKRIPKQMKRKGNRKKKQTRDNPWKQLLKEFGMFDDSDDFFSDAPKKPRRNRTRHDFFPDFGDIDEMFKMPKHMNKHDKNCNVKMYRTSQSYVKDGDKEEWVYDDNGKVTRVVQTPEGTRVFRDGEPEKVIKNNAKKFNNDMKEIRRPKKSSRRRENDLKLYGQTIDDINL